MASHADRAREIKALVEREPGLNSREVARRMGVSPATVSLVLAGLKEAGEVKQVRQGKGMGLHLTDQALRRRMMTKRWKL